MKKHLIILILLTLIAEILLAQFNSPKLITESDNTIQFSGQRGYVKDNQQMYITYLEEVENNSVVIFGYSDNYGNDFNFTLIDTLGLNFQPEIDHGPVLEILSNGDIIVFYTKPTSIGSSSLYKAVSTDQGETFDVEIMSEEVFEIPQIINHNDVLTLCYSTGANLSLSKFQHFTNYEKSVNADGGFEDSIVKFWGMDELWGQVHSNDDIWIANISGWPTFHDIVTTSGNFLHFPSGDLLSNHVDLDEIFPAGNQQQADSLKLEDTATEIREYGTWIGDEADIIYAKINQSETEYWLGNVEQEEIRSFNVYSWFPADAEQAEEIINAGGNWFEDSDLIWTNQIAIYDTVWSGPFSITSAGNAIFADAELWIEGEVAGKQTWGCSENAYLTGNIYYASTPVGFAPDEENNLNTTDYFGLISEKKIEIKYKHKDPETGEVCEPNTDDINLYGAYAAIAEGDVNIWGNMACHHDGVFTFEYQHPHGSTPSFHAPSPYTGNDTLYNYVDLHKFIFPPDTNVPAEIEGFLLHGNGPGEAYANQMVGYPYENPDYLESYPNTGTNYQYPEGTGYPWYNPIYPESAADIVNDCERGNINLWGSIVQRRRGFVHRSGNDPYNHPNQQEWDMDEYHFDGTHPSTGYGKNYGDDSRMEKSQLTDFIDLTSPGDNPTIAVFQSTDGGQNFEQIQQTACEHPVKSHSMDIHNNTMAIAYQTKSFEIFIIYSDDGGETFQELEPEFGMDISALKNIKLYDNQIYLCVVSMESDFIVKFNPETSQTEILEEFSSQCNLTDFNLSYSGEKFYTEITSYNSPYQFDFYYTQGSDEFTEEYTWASGIQGESLDPFDSEYSIKFDTDDSVHTCFTKNDINGSGLYLTSGYLPTNAANQDQETPQRFSLATYPNPFLPKHTSVNIRFGLPKASKINISIYNIKGKKVKDLIDDQLTAGFHSCTWDGKNEQDKYLPSGVYFYKLNTDNYTQIEKTLLLK